MSCRLCCQLHSQQPLDLVCLASSCSKKGLICYLCKLEQHQEHTPIVSLKIFLHSFLSSTPTTQPFIRETAQIDEELLLIQRKLHKLRPLFQDYATVEEMYGKFWKKTVEDIAQYDTILVQLQTLVQEKSDHQQKLLQNWIASHSDLFEPEDDDQQQKDTIYVAYLKAKLVSLKAIASSVDKCQEKGTVEDLDVLNLLQITKPASRLKLHFSQSLMGTCMTILSPNKASMTTTGNQRMMLLEPALSTSRSVKKWKVRIEKLASWIGVGVAHLDSVKGVNFDFSYTNANHGNYLVSSNGYSWNGYKMEFNSKFEPFQFTTGDTIQITYDPLNHKVAFHKEDTTSTFTYDVDPTQKPIHAAINMTGIGDCVEIIV